ncbi:ARMC4-like protein [Mya arenaria]|uniref:ARMC4-like protein n=1 Tax=Mya arenaria TaxID=6604 RepID=A0ABY7ESE5_MYAAR|nr:ARMC4-like protein [Mya arenaria]
MGQALARAAQWTSAKGGSGGKLEFTKLNEDLLNSVMTWLEGFGAKYPEELKLVFKSALTWKTSLRPDKLQGGFQEKGEDVVSSQTSEKDGTPMLTLHKTGSNEYSVSVMSLEFCENVLRMAGDQKLMEVRSCLEANRDPGAKMLGDRFATVEGDDNSIYRYINETCNCADHKDIEEKKLQLKLQLQINRLDQQLLQESIQQITRDVRLTPAMVDGEVNILKQLSGRDEEKHVLESIDFWGDRYVFKNGCRAQPWRQLHGDICYIEAKPHDGDLIFVTANTSGYFCNSGPNNAGELNYTKQGDSYRELAKDKDDAMAVQKIEKVDRDDDDYREKHMEKSYGREQTKDSSKEKSKTQKKTKKLEPSTRWKALGLEEYKEDDKDKDKKLATKKKQAPSRLRTKTPTDAEDSFSESSSESEEEEEAVERRSETNADLPSEYWQIQKLVKYLKGGNQTATIIALCSMRDFNLAQETCQLAIRDVGGLEIGSLKILKEISRNIQIRRAIADLGGLQTMVKILRDMDKDLKCLAAETIANVAKFRRARRTVRQHGGIKKLVGLLDCPPLGQMTTELKKDVQVARCGAQALWSCSKSKKNKEAMRKAGAIPLLARLLKSTHEDMLIPVVGTLQECASEPSYRLAIRTEGMIEDLVKNLKSADPELQMHCASAIFKCAEEKETRDLVRQYGGLDPLVALLQMSENKELLAAATGAIWKCAISTENVKRFQDLKAIDLLVGLLNNQPEEVLVNVVGALGELAKETPNRQQIRKAGGISPLVNLLTGTNQALLVNVTKAVGQCAEEQENMIIIDRLDGVRLLWSLLKNQNPDVQASAAWAICPCIENAKDAGEMVRSFVGGLELIVSLLKSDHKEVLASVCAAIANIAKDEENLAVITDHGVVPMLARLTNTLSSIYDD